MRATIRAADFSVEDTAGEEEEEDSAEGMAVGSMDAERATAEAAAAMTEMAEREKRTPSLAKGQRGESGG
jgi:hypothetical protein